MFRGILLLTFSTTLKSRVMYLFGAVLMIWSGGVYVLSNATFQITSSGNISLSGMNSFTGVSSLGAVLIFLSVFGASRRLPEMLRPTLAGFYLSKPISRTRLLSYTILSTTIVYSLVILVTLGIYGLLLHQWFPGHVPASEIAQQIGLEVIVFMIYVPMLSFLGLATRSGSFAFLLTFALWLLAQILSLDKMRGLLALVDNSILTQLADFCYYLLPRSSDISAMLTSAKVLGSNSVDWSPLWTSTLSAIGVYLLATLKFRRMDL